MRYLLFQVKPWPDRVEQYLDIAAGLRPLLAQSGGCEFLDRYRSIDHPAWILSFQIWRSEDDLKRWREDVTHNAAQGKGRREVFEDYRLRVGEVLREEVPGKPAWMVNSPLAATAPYVVMAESSSAMFEVPKDITHERYESIYRAGEVMHLMSVADRATALDLTEQCRVGGSLARTRVGVTHRDYGMLDRTAAPQQWP